MQALKRHAGNALYSFYDASSAQHSPKRRQPAHAPHYDEDCDMEGDGDTDVDEHAAAAGALLALQTATHASPSSKRAGGAAQRPQQSRVQRTASPTVVAAATAAEAATAAAAAAVAAHDGVAQYLGAVKAEDGRASCSLPTELGIEHASLQPEGEAHLPNGRPAALHSQKLPPQEPQTSNNLVSGSCGSAKDTFVNAANHDNDMLEDMEVTVVSETEKGCQVWFPPLPNEMEMRRRMRGQDVSVGAGGIKRKFSSSVQPLDQAGPVDDGACSMGQDEDAEQGGRNMGRGGSAGEQPDREGAQSGGRGSDSKRQRFIWTHELHERFVAAVQQLGVKTAVPKAILTLMKVEGMTRENVASHLQKFRMALRRMELQAANGTGGGAASAAAAAASDTAPRRLSSCPLVQGLVQEDGPALPQIGRMGRSSSQACESAGGGGAGRSAQQPQLLERAASEGPRKQGHRAQTPRPTEYEPAAGPTAAAPAPALPAPAAEEFQPPQQQQQQVLSFSEQRNAQRAPSPGALAPVLPLNFNILSAELLEEAKAAVACQGSPAAAAAALASVSGYAKPTAAVAAAAMAALVQQQGQALQLVANGGRLPAMLQQHGQVLQLLSGQGLANLPVCYTLPPLALQNLAAVAVAAELENAAAMQFATSALAAAPLTALKHMAVKEEPVTVSHAVPCQGQE